MDHVIDVAARVVGQQQGGLLLERNPRRESGQASQTASGVSGVGHHDGLDRQFAAAMLQICQPDGRFVWQAMKLGFPGYFDPLRRFGNRENLLRVPLRQFHFRVCSVPKDDQRGTKSSRQVSALQQQAPRFIWHSHQPFGLREKGLPTLARNTLR